MKREAFIISSVISNAAGIAGVMFQAGRGFSGGEEQDYTEAELKAVAVDVANLTSRMHLEDLISIAKMALDIKKEGK